MNKRQIEFINMVAPIAVRQAAKHDNKLFPSVTIAQAAWESGWGTSSKMVKANALYGVKVGNSAWKFGTAWKGKAYKTGTTEYYDGKNPTKIVDFFRAYDSIEDATEDYMDMLCHCKRYKAALNCRTPEESIKAIRAGGYATGPEYDNHIMVVINSANLKVYDENGAVLIPTSQWIEGKVYTLQQDLYIRDGADGNKVLFENISEDAQKKGKKDDFGYAILKKGARVTCKSTIVLPKSTWMQIPSGWICAKNSKITYVS